MKLRRIAAAFCLVSVVAWTVACGGIRQAAQKAQDQNDLKQIWLAWNNHVSAVGKGPSKPEDLDPYLEGATSPVAQALKSGKYVVYWDVSMKDVLSAKPAPATSAVVLAYAATTPTSGGPVVMVDGMVQEMTAAQFSAAKKASDFKKK